MASSKLRISQIFGPTIQGEGSAAGRHCLFVRTFECNQTCTWCDTGYTWAYTAARAAKTQSGQQYDKYDPHLGLKEYSAGEVLAILGKCWDWYTKPTIVVFSGGEPMMQQEGLSAVALALYCHGNEAHVETAGTIAPTPELTSYVTQYNVSPKLENSGNVLSKRYKPDVLRAFSRTDRAWFKFVVTGVGDFEEIDKIVYECDIVPQRVMVMPEGTTAAANIKIAQGTIEAALARGYGMSFRTHVLIWGDDPDR